MKLKSALIPIFMLFAAGCGNPLRLAPTEAQKQIAWQTNQLARHVEAVGTEPESPTAKKLATGTEAGLNYTGLPQDLSATNFEALIETAKQDAYKRPTAEQALDEADSWLGLAGELAVLLGVGGAGIGGKKLADWIALARRKSKAIGEIIDGNEKFKKALKSLDKDGAVKKAFGEAQNKSQKSVSTEKLVAQERVKIKRS
ncbi:MAG TPA: hypothetical protein HPP51_00750 [Planctomycetes bacterium]|nr:hypothetical protein [Planctomycetota bacterium]